MSSLWVGRSQDQPMRQWVKDVGKSEGYAVMAHCVNIEWDTSHSVISVESEGEEDNHGTKSSRKMRINDLDMGKQMTADFSLAGASMSNNAWLLSPIIVKSVQSYWRVILSR